MGPAVTEALEEAPERTEAMVVTKRVPRTQVVAAAAVKPEELPRFLKTARLLRLPRAALAVMVETAAKASTEGPAVLGVPAGVVFPEPVVAAQAASAEPVTSA